MISNNLNKCLLKIPQFNKDPMSRKSLGIADVFISFGKTFDQPRIYVS